MDKIKKLGDAELEIMLVIWRTDQSVTSNYILERLQGRRHWALSTLMTSLARLVDKGFVSCDRTTRQNQYSAVIAEEDYKGIEGQSFLEKLYGNSLQNFVTSLYDNKKIDNSDISDLREFLDTLEKEE